MFISLLGLLLMAGPTDPPLGVGVVEPHQLTTQPLLFYERPLPGVPTPHAAVDSLTFREGLYHIEIDHAPPGFAPFHQKLDYQILLLQATTIRSSWIEVVLNQETGKTAWVFRANVMFSTWEDFLLGVYAVEIIDPASNRLRSGPTEHGADMGAAAARQSFRPLAIQGNWMRVAPMVDGRVDKDARSVWIRWRDEDQLLIHYSLLS